MNKNWRTILLFAASGLAIAAFFFGYFEMDSAPGNSGAIWAGSAALVLCPGSFFFATLDIDIQPHTKAFDETWLIIGLINFALYAVIGTAYVRLRKKPDEPETG
jgi:hypothetical protein